MNRRYFLRLLGVGGVGGLGGCGLSQQPTQQTSSTPPTSLPISERAELAAEDGDRRDKFGASVTLSHDGKTAIIGAFNDDDPNGSDAGSAYVLTATGGGWNQQAKLTADDGTREDVFGKAVAASDDATTTIIGAPGMEDPNGSGSGSAYVFGADEETWTQQAKLTPDDGDKTDGFGRSVAVSGDGTTAIIGAFRDEDPNGREAGSAYVFTGADGSWRQETKLTPEDGDPDDEFGWSVAVSDDGITAIICARNDEDPNGREAGSAYVFTSADGSWRQETKLTPEDGDPDDEFGWSVALPGDGTTVIIGAPNDEDPNSNGAGSAYLFAATDGNWSQQAKLAPDDGDSFDAFGTSVAVSDDGTTAIIGAPNDEDPIDNVEDNENTSTEGAGSAYVFSLAEGTWRQQGKLTPDGKFGVNGDAFGVSVAMAGDGGTTIVGATGDDPHGRRSGSAYVFA